MHAIVLLSTALLLAPTFAVTPAQAATHPRNVTPVRAASAETAFKALAERWLARLSRENQVDGRILKNHLQSSL